MGEGNIDYDNGYSNGMSCRWAINCSNGTVPTISFNTFNTERNFDFVNIYDGDSTSDTRLARHHGSSTPPDVCSSGSDMLIRFTTDGSVTRSNGPFNADVTCGPPPPPPPPPPPECPSGAAIEVGMSIQVRPSVAYPSYGWGSVNHGDCGTVTSISSYVRVSFPSHSSWAAASDEMEQCGGCPRPEPEGEQSGSWSASIWDGELVDDPTWNGGYGLCPTYQANHANTGWCVSDGACAPCALSCAAECGSAPAPAPAPAPAASSRDAVPDSWIQVADRYCGSSGDIASYSTAAEALSACESDASCLYISDGQCNNEGAWETCSNDGQTSSSGSCMYQQPAGGSHVPEPEPEPELDVCMTHDLMVDWVGGFHASGHAVFGATETSITELEDLTVAIADPLDGCMGTHTGLDGTGFGDGRATEVGSADWVGTFADGSMTGKIALIRRGACYFTSKAINAQNAGAVAAIIYSDHRPGTVVMGGPEVGVTIPAIYIEGTHGDALNAAVTADPDTVVSIHCGDVHTNAAELDQSGSWSASSWDDSAGRRALSGGDQEWTRELNNDVDDNVDEPNHSV